MIEQSRFPELRADAPQALVFSNQNTSLQLLANYGSGSSDSEDQDKDSSSSSEDDADEVSDDSDVDILKQISQNIMPPFTVIPDPGVYREQKPFVVLHDTSDSSDNDDSDSDEDELKKIPDSELREHITVKLEQHSDESGEDENLETEEANTSKKKRDPLRVKGELTLDDLPPIEDLKISVPEDECIEMGAISTIVDQLVLVQAHPNMAPLDLDSVLFLEKGKQPLGKVFDVLGQVSQPTYCIRFNTHKDVLDKGISTGQKVYCAPRTEFASFVILNNIMSMKGSDASWKNDIEAPESQLDFSDDENERQIRRGKRQNRNRNRVINPANPTNQRRFQPNQGAQQRFPPWQGAQQQFPQNYSWHTNLPQNPGQFGQNFRGPSNQQRFQGPGTSYWGRGNQF